MLVCVILALAASTGDSELSLRPNDLHRLVRTGLASHPT
jgi:hypothetical protein